MVGCEGASGCCSAFSAGAAIAACVSGCGTELPSVLGIVDDSEDAAAVGSGVGCEGCAVPGRLSEEDCSLSWAMIGGGTADGVLGLSAELEGVGKDPSAAWTGGANSVVPPGG